jgi:hypothetical protein
MTSLLLLIFAQAAPGFAATDIAARPNMERTPAVAARVSATIIGAERIDFAKQSKRVGSGHRERFLVEFE